jgi:hypothetical protein
MSKELKIQLEDKGGVRLGFRTILYSVLLVVALTLAAVIAFNLGRDDGMTKYRTEFKAYQDTVVTPTLARSDSLKKAVEELVVVADSAKITAESLTTQINKVQKTNTSLRAQNARLSDSLEKTPLPPECDQCKRLVASLEDEVDSLQTTVTTLEKRDTVRLVEIGALRTGLTFQTSRADSLHKVIINFPPPPKPKKLLGIELSNRSLFIAGLVIGGTAVGVAK